jgi:8-oxo-dGTP pyrophosphatase MutT (NUDIX family)
MAKKNMYCLVFEASLNVELLLTDFLFENKSTCIFCNNEEEENKIWESIKSFFQFQRAAGGIIIKDNSFLTIYRFDHWDFPKGHVELGETDEETAMREVTEETAIDGLSIIKDLNFTYHIFPTPDNHFVLKETHWYEMSTTDNKQPSPQIEEDILLVEWIPLENMNRILEKTYPSLKNLIERSYDPKRNKEQCSELPLVHKE